MPSFHVNGTADPQRHAESTESLASMPIEVISGGMLCRLKVWNDREWAALTDRERPRESVHVPGLGWVGAVPVAALN